MPISTPLPPDPRLRVASDTLAFAYAAKVREAVPTLGDDTLDDYRRTAEGYGVRIIVGDLTGDEFARLCDEEIAARHVSARVVEARVSLARNAAALDDLDAAVRLIQAELGQTEGDIAAAFFDDARTARWTSADHADRVTILMAYVAFEETFA